MSRILILLGSAVFLSIAVSELIWGPMRGNAVLAVCAVMLLRIGSVDGRIRSLEEEVRRLTEQSP